MLKQLYICIAKVYMQYTKALCIIMMITKIDHMIILEVNGNFVDYKANLCNSLEVL